MYSQNQKSKGFPLLTALFSFICVFILGLTHPGHSHAQCTNTVHADVVALDQALFYNRQAAVNPFGMIYALRKDVVKNVDGSPIPDSLDPGLALAGHVQLRSDLRPRPLTLRVNAGECLEVTFQNLLSRDRNLNNVCEVSEGVQATGSEIGQCSVSQHQCDVDPGTDLLDCIGQEQPATRVIGMHTTGMQLVNNITDDGTNVGLNPPGATGFSGKVAPNGSITYTWYAEPGSEGTFLISSHIPGGEGNGGATANGLFGAVNVEPAGAEYYRSQLTRQELEWALAIGHENEDPANPGHFPSGHPIINYDALYPDAAGPDKEEMPIIKILQGNTIVHSDLRAIITGPNRGNFAPTYPPNPVIAPNDGQAQCTNQADCDNPKLSRPREEPFREITSIFHDDIFIVQAYPEIFEDPTFEFTLACCRDGFAINYGTGGIGAEVLSNRLGKGPMWDCTECKYEEFFLTSWAVGDPAMVVDLPASVSNPKAPGGAEIATKVLYPADPSNVDHSYIGDHVKIRNLHAGPKEHHIFHLHAHQWLFTPDDDNSAYLDSQAIGPGSNYTYDITYNGSGNRNQVVGDAIYHCHFYPHFAQGMWALWRNHDVFEMGTQLDAEGRPVAGARALPDGEITAGTPIPAVVPIPTLAMAPMPAPVEVAAVHHDDLVDSAGAPLSARDIGSNIVFDATLSFCSNDETQMCSDDADCGAGACSVSKTPAELIADNYDEDTNSNLAIVAKHNPGYPFFIPGEAGHRPPHPVLDTEDDGGLPRHVVLGGVATNPPLNRIDFSRINHELEIRFLSEDKGEPVEQVAMAFHAKRAHPSLTPDGSASTFIANGLPPVAGAPFSEPCVDDQGFPAGDALREYSVASIQLDMVFNKVGEHYPQARMMSLWEDVGDFTSGARPPEPLFFRVNSRDCIHYRLANLLPGEYKLDDYQVRTPTDVVGQHIHLVKFDVTASDGSANGWNYEDAAFSPDEVIERIHAINEFYDGADPEGCEKHFGACDPLAAVPHPTLGVLGAQTIIQRWYADETMNMTGLDRTLRTVYTHDHYAPSTHQQVGYYAGLLVEPRGSQWRLSDTGEPMYTRYDGGPTSWRADIITGACFNGNVKTFNSCFDDSDCGGTGSCEAGEGSYREFMFEFADFALGYEDGPLGAVVSHTVPGGTVTSPDPNTPGDHNFVNPALAINPPGKVTVGLPTVIERPVFCPGGHAPPCPEGVSVDDPGSFVVNYRNESVLHRVRNPNPGQLLCISGQVIVDAACGDVDDLCNDGTFFGSCQNNYCEDHSILCVDGVGDVIAGNTECQGAAVDSPCNGGTCQINPLASGCQADGLAGDMSHVFRSDLVRANSNLNTWQGNTPYTDKLTPGMQDGDPFTPLLEVFEDDPVQLRFMVGAHEEGHVESFFGVKWLQEPNSKDSGWRNAQTAGISEHFEFEIQNLQPVEVGPYADYLYTFDTASDGFATGVWGIMRSYRGVEENANLQPLPNNPTGSSPSGKSIANKKDFSGVCPKSAPVRNFNILAVKAADVLPEGKLIYNPRTGTFPEHPGPLADPHALMYILASDLGLDGKIVPGTPIEPLILRAKAGDCIKVKLTNQLDGDLSDPPHFSVVPMVIERFNTNEIHVSSHVGLHPQRVTYDIMESEGANIGFNVTHRDATNTASPGETVEYKWYAGEVRIERAGNRLYKVATPIEFGGINLIPSDPVEHSAKGLIAGLIIEPEHSTWAVDPHTRAQATVTKYDENGTEVETFREFVAMFQDDIQLRDDDGEKPICPVVGGGRVALDGGPVVEGEAFTFECEGVEDAEDSGNKAVNYRTEPMWFRNGHHPAADLEFTNEIDFTNILRNSKVLEYFGKFNGDPETPVFTAVKGTPVRFRILQPGGHPRNGVFSVSGHIWEREPYVTTGPVGSEELGHNPNSEHYGAQAGMGPMNHFEILIDEAGGPNWVTGDYLWANLASFQFDGGQWGLFRVCDGPDQTCGTDDGGGICQDMAEVPDVVGISQSAAVSAIEDVGLMLGNVQNDFDQNFAKGDVISSNPAAAEMLACGNSVDLLVSDGPGPCQPGEQVTVDVAGMGEQLARTTIADAGLILGDTLLEYNSIYTKGKAVRIDPPEPLCGDVVDLIISDGPAPICGNGMVETGEECDDGNTADLDGCDSTCQDEPPVCGNGVVESGEECDDGNTADLDGCSSTCQDEGPEPVCGNGIVETGEECDDGNTVDLDGCSSTCQDEAPICLGEKLVGESCENDNECSTCKCRGSVKRGKTCKAL